MPNGEDPNTEYIVLKFDSPHMVTGMALTDLVTREKDMLKLNKDVWEQHVGKRVKITTVPGFLTAPSFTVL